MISIELKEKRKSLLFRILLLTAACFIVILCGRISGQGHFTLEQQFDNNELPPGPEDLTFDWEEKELPMEELQIENKDTLQIEIHPDDPGSYEFHVEDQKGHEIFHDELHVMPLGLTYSESTGNFTGDNALIAAITLFFLGTAILCAVQFFGLKGPLLYSYDTVLTCGAVFFCTVTGLNLLDLFLRRMMSSQNYGMRDVYEQLSLSGGTFMLISSPIVLVFSLLMIVSNIALLRHERVRLQNVLGLFIGLLLIAGEAVGFWLMTANIRGSDLTYRFFYVVSSVYFTVFTYFECILLGSVICGFRAVRHTPQGFRDYILILGCGFRKDGTLSPLLKGRVDKALEFWHDQKKRTGKSAVLVPSGGQGSDEIMPESEAMARYLKSCGVPGDVILQENRSTNTYQNMEFSKTVIEAADPEAEKKNVLFVTTNYHVFRSGVWAGLAGLRAEGIGSRTKWWFWPNAFIRECIGLLANRVRQEIFWLIVLIVIFAGFAMQII